MNEELVAKLNLISARIQHEDNLIGQRTTWLVMSQSFPTQREISSEAPYATGRLRG